MDFTPLPNTVNTKLEPGKEFSRSLIENSWKPKTWAKLVTSRFARNNDRFGLYLDVKVLLGTLLKCCSRLNFQLFSKR